MYDQHQSYPDQLCEAAKVYSTSCNAHASFNAGDNYIALRIQAPEIMMQFAGDVEFGKDPKGRLFYKSDMKWPTARRSTYTIFYYRNTTSPLVVVRVDFFVHDATGKLSPFARFLANVKHSQLPPTVPGLGQGKWAQLHAAMSPMHITRPTDNPLVNLGSNSIQKQVHFKSEATAQISQSGFLFFRDLARLTTPPEHCLADYTSDRIVFYIEHQPKDVVALFFPIQPMDNMGEGTSQVTWLDIPEMDDPSTY